LGGNVGTVQAAGTAGNGGYVVIIY
jgi:hypothetical protein